MSSLRNKHTLHPSYDKDGQLKQAYSQIEILQREKQELESQLAKYRKTQTSHTDSNSEQQGKLRQQQVKPSRDQQQHQHQQQRQQQPCAIHGQSGPAILHVNDEDLSDYQSQQQQHQQSSYLPLANHKKSRSQAHAHHDKQAINKLHHSYIPTITQPNEDNDDDDDNTNGEGDSQMFNQEQQQKKKKHHKTENKHVTITKKRYDELMHGSQLKQQKQQKQISQISSSDDDNDNNSSNCNSSQNDSSAVSIDSPQEKKVKKHRHGERCTSCQRARTQSHKKPLKLQEHNHGESVKHSKNNSNNNSRHSGYISSATQLPKDKQSIQNIIAYLQEMLNAEQKSPNQEQQQQQLQWLQQQQQQSMQSPQKPFQQSLNQSRSMPPLPPQSPNNFSTNNLYSILGMNNTSNNGIHSQSNQRVPTNPLSSSLRSSYGGDYFANTSSNMNAYYNNSGSNQSAPHSNNLRSDAISRLKSYESDIQNLENKLASLRSRIRQPISNNNGNNSQQQSPNQNYPQQQQQMFQNYQQFGNNSGQVPSLQQSGSPQQQQSLNMYPNSDAVRTNYPLTASQQLQQSIGIRNSQNPLQTLSSTLSYSGMMSVDNVQNSLHQSHLQPNAQNDALPVKSGFSNRTSTPQSNYPEQYQQQQHFSQQPSMDNQRSLQQQSQQQQYNQSLENSMQFAGSTLQRSEVFPPSDNLALNQQPFANNPSFTGQNAAQQSQQSTGNRNQVQFQQNYPNTNTAHSNQQAMPGQLIHSFADQQSMNAGVPTAFNNPDLPYASQLAQGQVYPNQPGASQQIQYPQGYHGQSLTNPMQQQNQLASEQAILQKQQQQLQQQQWPQRDATRQQYQQGASPNNQIQLTQQQSFTNPQQGHPGIISGQQQVGMIQNPSNMASQQYQQQLGECQVPPNPLLPGHFPNSNNPQYNQLQEQQLQQQQSQIRGGQYPLNNNPAVQQPDINNHGRQGSGMQNPYQLDSAIVPHRSLSTSEQPESAIFGGEFQSQKGASNLGDTFDNINNNNSNLHWEQSPNGTQRPSPQRSLQSSNGGIDLPQLEKQQQNPDGMVNNIDDTNANTTLDFTKPRTTNRNQTDLQNQPNITEAIGASNSAGPTSPSPIKKSTNQVSSLVESLKIALTTDPDVSGLWSGTDDDQSQQQRDKQQQQQSNSAKKKQKNPPGSPQLEPQKINAIPDYMKVTENRCNYVRNVHQDYVRRSSSFTPRNSASPVSTPTKRLNDSVFTPRAAAAAAAAAARSHQEPLNWDKVLTTFVGGENSAADCQKPTSLQLEVPQSTTPPQTNTGIAKNKSAFARSKSPIAGNNNNSGGGESSIQIPSNQKIDNGQQETITTQVGNEPTTDPLVKPINQPKEQVTTASNNSAAVVQIRAVDLLSNPPDFEETLHAELEMVTKEIEAKKASIAASAGASSATTPVASSRKSINNNQPTKQPQQTASFSAYAAQEIQKNDESNTLQSTNTLRIDHDRSLSQINLENQSVEELSQLGITESELIDSTKRVATTLLSEKTARSSLPPTSPNQQQQQQQPRSQQSSAAKKSTYSQIKQRRDDALAVTPKSKQAQLARCNSLSDREPSIGSNEDSQIAQKTTQSAQKSLFNTSNSKQSLLPVQKLQFRKSSMGTQSTVQQQQQQQQSKTADHSPK